MHGTSSYRRAAATRYGDLSSSRAIAINVLPRTAVLPTPVYTLTCTDGSIRVLEELGARVWIKDRVASETRVARALEEARVV